MRQTEGSRRSGSLELRVRHSPDFQDVSSTDMAMSGFIGSTDILDPYAPSRRPHAPACAFMTAESGGGRLSSVSGTLQSFRIWAILTSQ